MNSAPKKFLAKKFKANESVAKEFYSEVLRLKNSFDELEKLLDNHYSKDQSMPIYTALIEAYAIINTEIEIPILAKFPEISIKNTEGKGSENV